MKIKPKDLKWLTARIFAPLVFALTGYLLIYLAFGSTLSMVDGMWDLITGGNRYEAQELMVNRLDGYTESVPSSVITFPKYGDMYGEIRIESADITAPLYYGDSDELLKKGVCQYIGSMYIGSGTTVLISGHNNTYLHSLGIVKVGDIIEIDTNYGSYVYEVDSVSIEKASDSSWYDLEATHENLELYTCYPFDALGLTRYRFCVGAKYVSGPKILYNE